MIGYATWLADVLRAAGLEVVEHDGWKTRGHYGGFSDLHAVVWHHDASAPGDSPNVPKYMLEHWDTAAAQLWVNRQGVWHVLAAGPAYHAGKVLAGKPGNHTSLGVETDHTTGEDWPPALLTSLRTGTAAILRKLDAQPDGLEFHKTVCDPPGRKTDPDGLDLADERRNVFMAGAHLISARDAAQPQPLTVIDYPQEDSVTLLENDGATPKPHWFTVRQDQTAKVSVTDDETLHKLQAQPDLYRTIGISVRQLKSIPTVKA